MKSKQTKSNSTSRELTLRRSASTIPIDLRILTLRRKRVILDTALAGLYDVPVKRLNEQTKRNRKRFPADFMFQLTPRENRSLRSQFATANNGRGGRRSLPYAFTEHGAVMAATVLNSEQAVEMSVFIVRAFIRLREMLPASKALSGRVDELEKNQQTHDGTIQEIVTVINKLTNPPASSRKKIGFAVPVARTG
jgi:ORF6N domain